MSTHREQLEENIAYSNENVFLPKLSKLSGRCLSFCAWMSELNVTVQISQHLNQVAFRYLINTTVLYPLKAILSPRSFYIAS